jgi:hypothetical protein
MPSNSPTLDQWRDLYAAAAVLFADAPWEWIYEDEIFGVRDPDTGQVGYVSIMGHNGEHLALAVYQGEAALRDFRIMATGQASEDRPEFLLEIPQLQASFENREELLPEDREVIKALGLKFRGRLAWPHFRSYVPGCLPWLLTAAEARWLTAALEQAVEVTRRYKQDRSLLPPLEKGHYLVRTLTTQGWTDQWLTPTLPDGRAPLPVDRSQIAAAVAKLRRGPMTLQVDVFAMLGTSVQENRGDRPQLPYSLLLVDADSSFVLGVDVLSADPNLDAMWEGVPAKLTACLQKAGVLPKKVVVRGEEMRRLLAPWAAAIGCEIKASRSLKALDQVRSELLQYTMR